VAGLVAGLMNGLAKSLAEGRRIRIPNPFETL